MSTLGSALKAAGFVVDDMPVYGRATTWTGVKWLMVHHTAGSDSASSEASQMAYLKNAPADRYPPLSQLGLGQSGKVWVISTQRSGQAEPGRASHAGNGVYPGISRDTGNQVALGIECHCSGAHALSTHKKMYDELIKLLVFLCKRYKLNETKVIGHKEYSSTGKIDPRDNMNTIRAAVKAGLAGGTGPDPIPPPVIEEDDMPTIIKRVPGGQLAVYNGVTKWRIGSNSPNYVARAFPGIKTVEEPDWFFDAIPDAGNIEYRVERYLDSKNSENLGLLRGIDGKVDTLVDREPGGGALPNHTHVAGGVDS